ncbi:imidazole glycerol phosphate synthase subunit HisH [Buchnera aphidicola (Taiwanaphis decaspermi)]|uniref:imidazole glycerol phosphate synthase subunit HisH n=1 Tax=Buchnera aphidicola TaxID=9 RepID=UPI0031B883D7
MNIAILDTGCSNLFSVKWSIIRLGYNPIITRVPEILFKSDKLLLPGVGTAKIAMQQIYKSELIDLIKNYKKPILGICLGMQLLGNKSDEGNINTLGLFDIPVSILKSKKLPLPHVGWNKVIHNKDNILFQGIPNNSWFYFVHSYSMKINKYTIAYSTYGVKFSSAIYKKNIFGVQFHPERSGKNGSKLIQNFLEI